MKTIHSLIKQTFVPQKLLLLSGILLLSACSTTSNVATTTAVVNTNQQQVEPVDRCKATADQMALNAANTQSQPQYLNAAKIYRSCSVTPPNNKHDSTSLTMKLYVLSTMNFIKGGDLKEASNMVKKFKRSFPQKDFYFANYTSFLDTAEALLQTGETNAQLLATLNISTSLRQELLRKDYWLKN